MYSVHRRILRQLLWVTIATLAVVSISFSSGVVTGTARANGTNFLQNSSFESGTSNWYAFAGGANTTTSVAHSGNGSLVMGTGQQGEAQNVTLQPNTIYSISGWGKTTGTGEYSQITLRVVDGSGNQVNYQMSFTSTDWTRQARTITTPSSVSSALVFIMKNAGTGYFYADDIFVGAGRDVEAWPFSSTSIWNTPVGSNAQYVSVPFSFETGFIMDGEPFTYADANAPWRQAYTNGSTSANDFGHCNLNPSQGSVGYAQGQVQLSDSFTIDDWTRSPNYTPNDASGEVMGDGRTMAQFEPTTRCSQDGSIFGYRSTDLDLYGSGNGGGHYGSGLSSIGGGIRQGEMTGPGAIHHALQLDLWMEKLASNNPTFRWPADRGDYNSANNYCSLDPCKSNPSAFASVKQGSLLAIPPSVTPTSLGLKTVPGQKIFQALQNYGGYIVDDTGWYFQGIGAEYGVDAEMQQDYGYTFNTNSTQTGGALDWYNDLKTIFGALQVVNNNSPTSIGGGGTPLAPLAPAFDQPEPPSYVALDRSGWTVTASLNNADAHLMLDGNTGSYWQTNQAQVAGQNFVVDMQRPQLFGQVSLDATDLSIYGAFPQGYEVDVSNDGTNWTEVHAGTGSGTSPTLATFPEQEARYIRVQLQGGNLNGVNSWAVGEFNVYRPPVGLDRSSWQISASSICCGYSYTNTIDGDITTRWSSGSPQSNGNFFAINLGQTQSFSQVVLDSTTSPGDYPHGYQVYTSSDGVNWGNPVASGAGNGVNPVVTISFPTQSAQYLKIVQTGSSGSWWSVDEVYVYP